MDTCGYDGLYDFLWFRKNLILKIQLTTLRHEFSGSRMNFHIEYSSWKTLDQRRSFELSDIFQWEHTEGKDSKKLLRRDKF